jgi:hypothetical protein
MRIGDEISKNFLVWEPSFLALFSFIHVLFEPFKDNTLAKGERRFFIWQI